MAAEINGSSLAVSCLEKELVISVDSGVRA